MHNLKIDDIGRIIISRESSKRAIGLGCVRDILIIMSDLIYEDTEVLRVLIDNGARRSKEKNYD